MFKNLKGKLAKTLTKTFLFLKESEIFNEILEILGPVIKENHKHFKIYVADYIKYKSEKVKKNLINFIIEKITLPWYLKPFKGKVKKTLENNFNKVIEFILKKVG